MQAAPAFVLPVRREPVAGWCMACVLAGGLVAGAAALASWSAGHAGIGWQAALLGTVWLVAAAAAGLHWRSMPEGDLSWNGVEWAWEQGAQRHALLGVTVEADLQTWLLLRAQPQTGATVWLLAARRSAPARWLDLRRALAGPVPRMLEPVA